MLVKYWMKRDYTVVDANDSVNKALKRLKEHRLRFLPVVEERKLVGVVSEGDIKKGLRRESPFRHIDEWMVRDTPLRVRDVMNSKPVTVTPELTMEEVVRVLLENRIPGAPVIDEDGRVLGTITEADLYRALIALCGFMERGTQFAFELEDRPGSLKEITDVIREHGGRIAGILTSYDTAPPGYRHAYIRVFGIDPDKANELSKVLSRQAKMIYNRHTEV
ncbi:MAG: CBS and ACT domain-containing protein [Pseudomonadota bacterium]